MKTFIKYAFNDAQMKKFEDLGLDIIDARHRKPTQEEIESAEAFVSFANFDKYPIENWKNLRFIQSVSAGVNTFPMEELEKRGIVLCNAKGVYSRPIAEWVVMRILAANKRILRHFKMQEEKVWEQDMSFPEVGSQTIGFVGTGSLATESANLLKAFGPKMIGYNTDGRSVEPFDETYPLKDIRDTMGELDVIVLTAPEMPELTDFVNADFLSHLKENIVFINVGRGTIVDEDAMEEFLNKNNDALAILDVFKTEPLPQNHPFWTMDNLWVSPHVVSSSNFINDRITDLALHNLKAFMEGTPLKNEIDLQRGY